MKKLDLFPEKRLEISSPLSAEDALCALGKEMRHSKSIYMNFPFEETGGKKFKGAINKNTFKAIRYSAMWSNLLIINGEVLQDESGSRIALSFSLRKDIKISLMVFPLIPMLFSLYASISAKDPLVFIVVSAFAIGLYFIEMLALNCSVKATLKRLKKIFCA